MRTYGLNKHQRNLVCEDVGRRLTSLLSHWDDEKFRRTILTLGIEEAAYWEPSDVDLEVRSLVVLCVRNSLIEEFHAEVRSRRQIIPDEDMPQLTAEAINYFKSASLGDVPAAPGKDLFGSLPKRFPNAWQCLSALAELGGGEADYILCMEKAEPLALPKAAAQTSQKNPACVVVASGMDESINRGLADVLRLVATGELQVFPAHSFSRITRNPAKLLAILDHLLRHGAAFVTPNYALTDTFVARRSVLRRIPHSFGGASFGEEILEGLSPRHRELFLSPSPRANVE